MAPSRRDETTSDVFIHESNEYVARYTISAKGSQLREVGMPRAWKGSNLTEADYLVVLNENEIAEIESAATQFIASKLPTGLISPTTFPLPVLATRLFKLRERLHTGLGFFIIRGLQPANYENLQNIVIYAGISSYIGDRRAVQYPGGPVLTHVIDLSSEEDVEKNRGRYIGQGNQNMNMPFHTDNGHILCLYSIHSASIGGRSRLASSRAIIKALRHQRPDIVQTLKERWEWDTFAETPASFGRPLLFEDGNRTILSYSRRPLIGTPDYPRRAGLKPLTSAQEEALDKLEESASSLSFTFNFNTGDIQYVNNLAILHGREAFQNECAVGCRRHLLRMFLKDEENELPLPTVLDSIVDPLYVHEPEHEKFPWTLEPLPYILSP